ncbi:Thiamine pyrophosphate (TPP)-dependent enzyme [Penicillium digitatum]|uniref:Thiamine pyrophosphate (TPP)-dependent enzyme n=1 Tax=Penicillium digitatum TaxID=36651 RepID=A0A7T6XU45_PENDI|nr:hypothetical protein PDIDSM_443 [Penicillium digitatum]QQK47218.1 Thiamine pyrophosphate (TPP)-dependent enzyme [Penicillium digitatum]
MLKVSVEITLAGHLLKRLHHVGLQAVHAVPGNYNIEILREATDAGLEWVAYHSDLSAEVVADGYVRVKSIAALMSSFQNISSSVSTAITSSFRDRIPVVLVIRTPQRKAQAQATKFHHSFFDAQPDIPRQPDIFQILADCFENITITQEFLVDPGEAADCHSKMHHAVSSCLH